MLYFTCRTNFARRCDQKIQSANSPSAEVADLAESSRSAENVFFDVLRSNYLTVFLAAPAFSVFSP